jgi:UDP-glucose:(heptosyl)LPS alpha-1,3-glucosyltransferase
MSSIVNGAMPAPTASVEPIETALAAEARTALSPRAERLRIAVVTPELHRKRGTERVTSEMVVRLAAQHDVHVFAHYFRAEDYPGVQFHRVPVLPWPGLATFLSFYYVSESVVKRVARRAGAFDVVYSPGPNCAAVDVATAHFCQARQNVLLKSGEHQPKPAGLSYRLRHLHRRLYARAVTRIERQFYRSSKLRLVLSPSDALKRDLVENYGIEAERVRVTPSGVDATGFTPEARMRLRADSRAALGLCYGRTYFLFIGTDWIRKGMMTILRALREVPDADLLAIGPYDPRPYRRASEELGVTDRVIYLPRRTDVLFYYAAADALLAPSIYEPFGLVPLEAMACGLPCVITRNMGVAEIVSPGEAIVLENGEDAAALARAMRALMNDPSLRERLVTNGIELAQRHTWETMYTATLDELASAARAARDR